MKKNELGGYRTILLITVVATAAASALGLGISVGNNIVLKRLERTIHDLI